MGIYGRRIEMSTFDYIGGIASIATLVVIAGYGIYCVLSFVVNDTANKIFEIIEGKQE